MIRSFSKEAIPLPPDFQKLPSAQHLDVEIGCGVGFHPIHYALKNPDRYLIAFERTKEKHKKFIQRFENHKSPSNLLPIHGDAIHWLAQGDLLGKIEKIIIFYPNPYPKSGQKNLRWGYSPAVHLLVSCLKKSGEIHIRSNQASYMNELKANWPLLGLKLKLEEKVLPNKNPATHFEKKYLSRGEECWQQIWQKVN